MIVLFVLSICTQCPSCVMVSLGVFLHWLTVHFNIVALINLLIESSYVLELVLFWEQLLHFIQIMRQAIKLPLLPSRETQPYILHVILETVLSESRWSGHTCGLTTKEPRGWLMSPFSILPKSRERKALWAKENE